MTRFSVRGGVAHYKQVIMGLCREVLGQRRTQGAMLQGIEQITIIGTGLLGGSIGLGLRRAGYGGRRVGFGRRAEVCQRALERGCIDAVYDDLGLAVRDSQLVVVATPLGAFGEVFEELARHDHDGLIVTDVGSTKRGVCEQAREVLPDSRRFVGAHPMAGGERHGPDHARADLFESKPCIITPLPETDPGAQKIVEELWAILGMRLIHMTPQQHDERVAVISHLPHLVAVLLVDLAVKHDSLDVASTGFADTTRIAGGDAGIWGDIFTSNRDAVVRMIDSFAEALGDFRQALAGGDQKRLREVLQRSKEARDNWPKARFGFDRRRSTGSD